MEQQPRRQASFRRKKPASGRRSDTPLHAAVRAGNLAEVRRILSLDGGEESDSVAVDMEDPAVFRRELIARQNEDGETAFYVAAEGGHMEVLAVLLTFADEELAEMKTRSGVDALHAAAKQGCLDAVRALLERWPGLATTTDKSNRTVLYSAATQGHVAVVRELLAADDRLLKVAMSNGKTAVHSAVRRGHLEVVWALLEKDGEIGGRTDNKVQTPLHMAAKGQSVEVVKELVKVNPAILNLKDKKGNTALHVATRKGRTQDLLNYIFAMAVQISQMLD